MPFDIREEGGQYCVYTEGTDHKHGCHSTWKDAVAQLRALYANVPDAGKSGSKPTGSQGPGERYADPGFQPDKQPRYPVTENGKLSADRIRAAWGYIHHPRDRAKYTADQLSHIEGVIRAAAKEAGVEIAKSAESNVEVKSYDSTVTVQDADQGIVHAIVSVFGNIDSDGDRLVKGAFSRTIAAAKERGKFPPGVWSHDWKTPVAKTLDMYEGDDGLHVIGHFNLETQAGKDTYSNIKHGIIDEYSFGFSDATREAKDGANNITDLLMFEWSPTLVGSNRQTRTVAVKDGAPRLLSDSTEETTALVESAKERVADLAGAWQAIALKEGRVLAAARRQRLSDAHDTMREYLLSLGQSLDLIADLLTETDPSQSTRDEMQRQILRMQASTARSYGVMVE